ncbi:FUK kinase, partial [Polypterus senegalus]
MTWMCSRCLMMNFRQHSLHLHPEAFRAYTIPGLSELPGVIEALSPSDHGLSRCPGKRSAALPFPSSSRRPGWAGDDSKAMERRMRDTPPVRWTVIVLTCQYKDSVHVFQQDRLTLIHISLCDLEVLGELAVFEDILTCSDALKGARILILHMVAPGSPPGVWVSSSDMLIQIPTALDISWSGFTGVKVLSLPGDVEYAKNHGVYLTDHRVSGIVFFSKDVAELLLQTHVIHPLDACTYLGLDSGTPPLQLSLFFDILLCLACNVTQDEYLNGQRHSNSKEQVDGTLRNARTVLWKELRGIPLTLEYIPNGTYNYMSLSGEQHIRNMTQRLRDTLGRNTTNMTWAHVEGPLTVKSGCILSGIDLQSSISLQDCTLSDIIIQGHYVKLGDERRRVFTVLGRQDNLEVSLADSMSSFLNNSWTELFKRTGIRIGELWQPAEDEGKSLSLYDTYLFPVLHMHGPVGVEGVLWLSGLNKEDRLSLWRAAWRMSMREILNCLDQEAELNWRKELFFQTARLQAQDTLRNRMNCSLWPLIRAAVQENQQNDLLAALDTVAAETPHPGVAARTLAAVADVLGCMAERKGGLRSGPAANPAWNSAFRLLETGELQSGVKALAAERKNWLSRPDLLVRAARHYEAAGQILIRQAVATAREFIKIGNCDAPPFNQWVEVECPARLDIAGGWSDTPPITFEHGGAVVNIAVQVDGRRPIGARARRIRDPCLLLISHSGSQGHQVTTETICRTMKDINDYCQPHAPSTSSILAGAIMAAIYESAGRSYSTEALLHVILHLEQILTTGSLTQIGSSLDQYWQQKKVMARGCEPTSVSAMMAALKPLALGQSLAGAGGGGFLYLLTKEPHQADHVRDILSKTEGVADFSIHHVEVDLQGVLIQKKESCLP